MMIPSNITQLIGIAIYVGSLLFGFLKVSNYYLENDIKKQEAKSKEAIEVSRNNVELAKSNLLTASQVAQILENYRRITDELEHLKNNGQEKNKQILDIIDKLEDMIKQQTQNFTEFIMNRANNITK